MHEKIKKFVEDAQESIDKDMKDNGQTLKALFMFNLDEPEEGKKPEMGVMPLAPDMDGEIINVLVNSMRPQFDVVVMIAESWKSANPKMAPSEDPDRTEVMMIVVYNKENTYIFISDMNRIGDEQVIMGDWEDMSEGAEGGRLNTPYRNHPSLN